MKSINKREILIGKKGGRFYMNKGKKVYIRKPKINYINELSTLEYKPVISPDIMVYSRRFTFMVVKMLYDFVKDEYYESKPYPVRPPPFTHQGTKKEIRKALKKWILDIIEAIRESDRRVKYYYPEGNPQIYRIPKKPADIKKSPMFRAGSLNIHSYVDNSLFNVNENQCVLDYLFHTYPQIFTGDITREFVYKLIYPDIWVRQNNKWINILYKDEHFETNDINYLNKLINKGVNTEQLLCICKHFKIPMRAFDNNMCEIVYHNCNSRRTIKGKKISAPPLYYMVKNNHLYALTQEHSISLRNARGNSIKTEKTKKEQEKEFKYLENDELTPYEFLLTEMEKENEEAKKIRNTTKGAITFNIGKSFYIGQTKQDIQHILNFCSINGIKYDGQSGASNFTNSFTDLVTKSSFNPQARTFFNTFNRGQVHMGKIVTIIPKTEEEIESDKRMFPNKTPSLIKHHGITDEMIKNKKEIDLTKCHRNILLNPNNKWFQFSCIDTFKKISNDEYIGTDGFYFVETDDVSLFTGDGLYTNKIIDIAKKYKIRYTLRAIIEPSFTKDKNIFKKPVNDVLKYKNNNEELNLTDEEIDKIEGFKKNIINCVAGVFGINSTKREYIKINTDFQQVCNDIIELEKDTTKHITWWKQGKYYFYGHETRNKLLSTNRPLYLQVIEQANIRLFELQQTIIKKGGIILYRYSDEIHYYLDKPIEETEFYSHKPTKIDIKMKEYEKPIKYVNHKSIINSLLKKGEIEWKIQPENNSDQYATINKSLIKNGGVIQGAGGTGKTYILKKLTEELTKLEKSYCVCAYTNIASRLINGETLHKFFGLKPNTEEIENNKIKNMNIPDYVIVDEMSMINSLFYNALNEIKIHHPKTKIILLGDYNQIPPVNEEHLDFKNSYLIRDLTNANLWILTKNHRANDELPHFLQQITEYSNDMIEHLLHKRLTKSSNLDDMVKGWNIGYNNMENKEGIRITKTLNNHHAKIEKPYTTPWNYKLIKGMKVICNVGSKKSEIAKNSIFVINDYTDYKITMTDITFGDEQIIDIDELCKNYVPAYIITAEKSQGQTLKGNVYIHQINKILNIGGTYNKMYVALGRATGFNKLFIGDLS